MSDFKTLKGLYIKHISSDPPSPIEGQIWYNTSSKTLKVAPLISAWSAGGALNTGRSPGGLGIQTAALAVSGPTSSPANGTEVESYDGTSWTEVADVNTARRYIGISTNGSTTAAVAAGGDTTTGSTGLTGVSEEFDGSSWTEGPDLNTSGARMGAGTQTAGLVMTGGTGPGPSANTKTEEYNGTSWSEVEDYPSEKVSDAASCGTQTAAMVATGFDGSNRAYVNEYDGTNWAAATAYPSARYAMGLFGIQTSAIGAGGSASPTTLANSYDGTNWTAVGSLGTGRQLGFDAAAGANSTAGLVFGSSSRVTTSEEYIVAATVRSVDTS